jgi:hypothetical protein
MKRRVVPVILAVATPVAAILLAGAAAATPSPKPVKTIAVKELTPFTSPSGNIGCYIETDYVRCDIRERNWAPPPKPSSCPDFTGWGQGIQLKVGQPVGFVCAGDTALTTENPLAYGDTVVAGSIECSSAPSGIGCRDVEHGGEFTISREGYHIG